MDSYKKIKRATNPKEKAGFFSLLTFFYSLDIIRKAYHKKDLAEGDLYEVVSTYRSEKIGSKLEIEWNKLLKQDHPSVYKLIWLCYGKTYLFYGIVQLIMKVGYALLFPYSLSELVKYFQHEQQEVSRKDAMIHGGLVVGLTFLFCIYNNNYTFQVTQLGMKARTAFCSLIYRKCLRLSPTTLSEFTTGNIITLINKDCFTMETVFQFSNDIWVSILLTIITGHQIQKVIGWIPTLVGIGLAFITKPLEMLIGRLMSRTRVQAAKKTDERLQSTQEVLTSIKLVKMYTWEDIFISNISALRNYELSKIRIMYFFQVCIFCISFVSTQIGLYLLIMTYIWLGNEVNAGIVYYLLGLYGSVQMAVAYNIPFGIIQLAEMHAGLTRIKKVLCAEEISTFATDESVAVKPLIEIKNMKVTIEDKTILQILNLTLESGLNILTGPLGCGKSTLLKTLIREQTVTEGKLLVQGKISYASEIPWLFPASIRQNILFGEPYDAQRYQQVLHACELSYDLSNFNKGDDTLVGDKGVNLSKGQQVRINLARAAYKTSDIYLLDDCLSSLDTHVQRSVFMKCIKQFLGDKLCVLVSHSEEFLNYADNIVVLENGRVKSVYNSPKLLQNRISKFIDEEENKSGIIVDDLDDLDYEIGDADKSGNEKIDYPTKATTPLLIEIPEEETTNIYREKIKQGEVPFSIYHTYMNYSGGIFMWILLALSFAGFFGLMSYNQKLLSSWMDMENAVNIIKKNFSENSTEYKTAYENKNEIILLYNVTTIINPILAFIISYWFYLLTIRSSMKIHKHMLRNVVKASMNFFDNFFIGNILNRFSKDLCTIDDIIPSLSYMCLRLIVTVLAILIMMVIVNKIFIIPGALILGSMYFIRMYYMPTGRSLKRLDAATKSPVVGHMSSSIQGMATIRAHRKQRIIRQEFDRHQDLYTSAYHTSQIAVKAFGFALDLFCAIFVAIVVATFLILDKGPSAGEVGLAITQVVGLVGILQMTIRDSTELQNYMISVERAVEFISAEQEPKNGVAIKDWPQSGTVRYEDVSLKYKTTGELILRHINFSLRNGQRIGIVGRTGAGKSSIVATLFHLYPIEGKVYIDSKDTKQIPLTILRSNISIIPQDPVLFTGTIRSNIDPKDEYSDRAIWDVLNDVGLVSKIENLETTVSDGGLGYSSGQKQLLCLARALIQDNRIVVLDEATANMDSDTAALIQEVIKTKLERHTVLIIAHRLNTVLDTDKIMVIHKGKIIEFDYTRKLLEDKDSKFRRMVKKAGLL